MFCIFCPATSPPIDVICAVMLAWSIKGKIIRTVRCCIVYHNCTQLWAHTIGFSLCFIYLEPVCLFCVFWCIFSCLFCVVSTSASDCLEDSSPKWPVMCQAGRKTTHSHTVFFVCLSLLPNGEIKVCSTLRTLQSQQFAVIFLLLCLYITILWIFLE